MNNNEVNVKSEMEDQGSVVKALEVKVEEEVVPTESSIPPSLEEKGVLHWK